MAVVALGILAALWAQGAGNDERRIVIASKQFSEQYILAQLIGARLEAAGYVVEYRDGLGSAVVHSAVACPRSISRLITPARIGPIT